jgi:hypothetical protein
MKGIAMGYLQGLQEYLDAVYENSIFDRVLEDRKPWEFHLHSQRIIRAAVVENSTFDLKVDIEGQGEEELPKTQVKSLYPIDLSEAIQSLVKFDDKVRSLELGPILKLVERNFVKNKSLFILMKERQAVTFTLLEGEVIKGLIGDFSRYDITVNLKGGVPITLLRHSIHDLRNKKGRCFMKSAQEKYRDWEKSDLFVSSG